MNIVKFKYRVSSLRDSVAGATLANIAAAEIFDLGGGYHGVHYGDDYHSINHAGHAIGRCEAIKDTSVTTKSDSSPAPILKGGLDW